MFCPSAAPISSGFLFFNAASSPNLPSSSFGNSPSPRVPSRTGPSPRIPSPTVSSRTGPSPRVPSPTVSSRTGPSPRVPSSRVPSRTGPSPRVPARTSPSPRIPSLNSPSTRVPCVHLGLPTSTGRVRSSWLRGGADVDVRVPWQQ
ncbi:unnamed protein product [Closterium sp. Naga37s-1]|nr:unnamed protein product [Closterium sp. Naga37s-1]